MVTMAIKKNPNELTAHQAEILAFLPDDEFHFPGCGESAALGKLVRLGFAEADLRPYRRDYSRGIAEFRTAYRRTPAGKAKATDATKAT